MRGYHKVSKAKHKLVNELLDQGLSKRAIAAKTKLAYGTILSYARKHAQDAIRCSVDGCKQVAEGILRGKWLCPEHRKVETAQVAVDLNKKLAEKMGVEVVDETPVVPVNDASHYLAAELIDTAEKYAHVIKTGHLPGETAEHFDTGKPRMDLIDWQAMMGLAQVLEFGAKKYEPNNWRRGMEWNRIAGSALRHISSFLAGEDLDRETGLSHIDHAMCCLMFLSSYVKTGVGTDDRWKPKGPV